MEVILEKKEDLRKRLRLKRLSFFELATIIQLALAISCYFLTAFTPLSRIQLLVIKIPNFLFILPPNPNVDTTKITRKYKAVSKYLVWGNALFWALVWMIFPPRYNYLKTVKSVLSAGIHSYNLTWRLANSLEFEFDIEIVFDWIANKLGGNQISPKIKKKKIQKKTIEKKTIEKTIEKKTLEKNKKDD
ncbi:hypothetical protein M0812_00810 [Anaeramoeba flamelloides]|uniref:Uncharacterized protein n=1 Tax=Anaeramoeba flamelloides TaxID=1746091 RepID=A0AAV8A5P9_9EUKA|nr:hypothetical protein M0812_00810 [Anaeramoeba flamelloides]